MNNHLFLFTIGPVQGFIAQARKTRDLYAGSQILSNLVQKGMDTFVRSFPEGKIVFPYSNGNGGSLPNRFIGKVSANRDELKIKGKHIEQAIRKYWLDIGKESAQTYIRKDSVQKAFDAQIESLLDIHWVFQEIDDQDTFPYAAAYEKIERMGGSIKTVRKFSQYQYDGYGEVGRKCSVDGINNVLFYRKRDKNDKGLKQPCEGIHDFELNPGEGLSAVSFTKRFFNQKIIGSFPSTAEVALLKDLKNVPQDFKDCYKKLFSKNQNQIFEAYQEIQKNPRNECKEKIQLDHLSTDNWNNSFDAHYYFEENLTSSLLPNDTQRELIKHLHSFKLRNNLKTRYYAIIIFDGDKMGSWLSGEYNNSRENLEDFHQKISQFLGEFGMYASAYLNKDNGNGHTVYAGGDDFMGFVNIHSLFQVMKDLREKFDIMVNQRLSLFKKPGNHLTFSAGIVIAHYKTPFSEVLKKAREIEKTAKNQGERNAFGIGVMKHSGEIQEAVYKWDSDANSPSGYSNWEALENIYTEMDGTEAGFSNTYIQNLTVEISSLTGVAMSDFLHDSVGKKVHDTIIPCEIKRLVARSWNKKGDSNNINLLTDSVTRLWDNIPIESSQRPRNFVHALHIADFMTRKIKG